jgi:phage I-like protein
VSRSGNGTGTPANRATLTREQADMAKMMGMTPAEYHKNMMDLKKEGKMN